MMNWHQINRVSKVLFIIITINLVCALVYRFQLGVISSVQRMVLVVLVLLCFVLDGKQTNQKRLSLPLAFSWAGIIGMIAYRPFRISIDSAMYLDLGRRVLAGEIPYIDFMEINPPTIYYLSAAVMWIAKVVKLNPMPVFLVSITLLIVLISFICAKSLRRAFPDDHMSITRIFPLTLAFCALLILLANSYGQREHIFVLLFLPWLLLRWNRWQGNPVEGGWIVGLACALAVTLKPHFILFPIFLELYWIIEQRSLREIISIEWMVVILCAVGYSAVLILPADLRQGILNDLLLMLRSGGYAAYGSLGISKILIRVTIQATPLIALLPWIPGLIADAKKRSLLRTISIFTFVSILIYLLQDKGWDYHFIPALTGSVSIILILNYLIVTDSSFRESMPQRNKWFNFLLLLLLVPLIVFTPVLRFPNLAEKDQEVSANLLTYTQQGDAVIVVSNAVDSYLSIIEHGRRNVSTYNVAYPVAFEYFGEPYTANSALSGLAQKYVESLEQDIFIHKPNLILVENFSPCKACPKGFSYAAFLDNTGFTSTILETDYTYLDIDTFYFDVWLRTETLPAR
jgi:hypothetical protein